MRSVSAGIKMVCLVLFLCGITFNCLPGHSSAIAEEDMLDDFQTETITVEGELIKVKMTQFEDNPWEEFGIKAVDGKTYILIGKAVKNITESIGQSFIIKGQTKPPMLVKGERLTVIEVQSAQLVQGTTIR